MEAAAVRPAPMARMTVAAPVTMSPPAKTPRLDRLAGALGTYYASPVASGGRLYLASQDGHIVVVKAGPDWEGESVGDLGEPVFATPAIAEGRLYVRTPSARYCFSGEHPRRATTDQPAPVSGP
jgi:hypothetical protein